MRRIKNINEFFGFSAREKEIKQIKLYIENLKKELYNFNWIKIVSHPGKDNWSNDAIRQLTRIRNYQAKEELPHLYKLLPELFEFDNTKMNAAHCRFKLNDDSEKEGIIPVKFSFIIDPYTRTIENSNETRDRANKYIMDRIKSKYNLS